MNDDPHPSVILRLASPELDDLTHLARHRYPMAEWACFLRLGWRETAEHLVLTLAGVDQPGAGDLDAAVSHVAIQEQFTLRIALAADQHNLGVGVMHSHPQNYAPQPSVIDDDMDFYYADYFSSFAPNRPYVSLIYSETGGREVLSGRVYWLGRWLPIQRLAAVPSQLDLWEPSRLLPDSAPERVARLASAFGLEAAAKLRKSTVGVVGAGGTGSAVIEALARGGVGHLILVDPDVLEHSNLERVHGSMPRHADRREFKVAVAAEHVAEIDPSIRVEALVGRLPQSIVIDALCRADVVLGCTDQQHSRLALSDLSLRYLVPVLDCGVSMEGENGHVTGQIMQTLRMLPADPCVLCQGMIDPQEN